MFSCIVLLLSMYCPFSNGIGLCPCGGSLPYQYLVLLYLLPCSSGIILTPRAMGHLSDSFTTIESYVMNWMPCKRTHSQYSPSMHLNVDLGKYP